MSRFRLVGVPAGDFWSALVLAALGTYVLSAAWKWDYLTPDGPMRALEDAVLMND